MSIELGLDRIRTLLSHLPSYSRPTCHIAGTNGKGSVSAFLSSILVSSSPPLTVGRFNSPHLVDIYDCITIDNQPITASTYAAARQVVEKMDKEHKVGASSFELLTSTALLVFEQAKVDVVVMEVGMGGRLDATNVIPDTSILVSAVTAVDLDHQAFLGGSVDAIAREKAGISRKGRPLVLGPQKHQEVLGEVEKVVAESRGELIFAHPAVPRTWDESVDGPLPNAVPLGSASFQGPSPQPVEIPMPCFSAPLRALLPLPGEHQLVNMGLACEVISTILTHPSCNDTRTNLRLSERVTVASIIKGIRSTVWPGRLSFHTISLPDPLLETPRELTVLVDGAHNPSSSATLSSYVSDMLLSIEKRGPQHPTSRPRIISITFILALSHSPPKTPLQTLQPLFPLRFTPSESTRVKLRVALLRFTPPEGMPWVTSESPSILAGVVSSLLGNADADDIWCAPENAVPGLGLAHLKDALQWAAAKQDEDLVSEEGEGFVVLAGSLYLVADLYRLMREDLGRS